LGYVGLPLAIAFSKKFKVIGVNGFKEMDHYGKKLNLDYIKE